MFKNMKVGTKIGLGFAIVLFITVAVSTAVNITNYMSASDLNIIGTMAEFELNAGEFSASFDDARMRANTVFQSTNAEEYNRAAESFNSARASLQTLAKSAETESSLSEYTEVLQTLTVSLDSWKEKLDSLHFANQNLDGMRADFEAQAVELSLGVYSLYLKQFDNLYKEIVGDSSQTRILQALRKAQSSGDLVTGIHTIRREFVQLSDFFIVDGVPGAVLQIDGLRGTLTSYRANTTDVDESDLSSSALDQLNAYEEQALAITDAVNARNTELAEALALAEDLAQKISTLTGEVAEMSRLALVNAQKMGAFTQKIVVGLSASAVIVGLLTALLIVRGITKPVREMTEAAGKLREGSLNLDGLSYRSKDEIGQLCHNMRHMAKEIQQIIEDMHAVNQAQEQGEWDARVDESKFRGAYRELAASSNALTESYIRDMLTVTRCMESFSQGDFHVEIKPLPGKKAIINQTVDTFKENMQGVSEQISKLTHAANQGRLSVRADASAYQGGWAEILVQLNALLRSITGPINEASQVIQQIAGGHFRQLVNGDYKGDFLVLKNTVNGMAGNISGYIYEISHILTEVNNNNLDQEITREYLGDFAHIKTAINEIIQKFNKVIYDIFSAADSVTLGARSISETSMKMAEGASRQAASVRVLGETVSVVNRGTHTNAEEAGRADAISDKSREKAARGNKEMSAMLNSMEGIKDSSNNISKIISAIDDIASQTNMLALNAAVEAVRAGENGKGFAVVAEEVRGLAVNSQQNAQQSTLLVKESIEKITEGQNIATETAKSLREIVEDVNLVAEIIKGIAQGSRKQADAIAQISDVITQISDIVNQNSATSEETAAAAQQLSSQADVLHGMMEVFTLKGEAKANKNETAAEETAERDGYSESTELADSPASGNEL